MFLDYTLPHERIAQHPIEADGRARTDAKLLVGRGENPPTIEDRYFSDLPSFLQKNDLIVLNNTRVVSRRFFARMIPSGAEFEILLLDQLQNASHAQLWEALGKPLRKLQVNDRLLLSEHLQATVKKKSVKKESSPHSLIELEVSTDDALGSSLDELIEREGSIPIPPYIRKGRAGIEDNLYYQSVFSQSPGSLAAPTAGLHFTKELLEVLNNKGIAHAFVTLHLGTASFLPIRDVETHQLQSERFIVPTSTREAIKNTKANGGRIIAVGTSTTRALEADNGESGMQETTLFIKPGFEFRVVDSLITNFHQPGSSHLLLVQAYMGIEPTAEIYLHALKGDYRFLSYGDAMYLRRECV